ncbi:hypothetical protein GGR53DRAFT_490813 [Hypoxylon sp. FL1150]|nr:hypothetical protein GGR53DRAFT_490813 [Hypoxylon sp. FL1150]
MPPRRKQPTPTEADSESDGDMSLDLDYKPSASIPQAMEGIHKWKSKRSGIQKSIEKDFTDKLAALKIKIEAHYRDETQKASDHNQQQLERLIAALGKRLACEEKINQCIDSLRDDSAHLAMLVDAIYAGRKEAATQSAKVAKAATSNNPNTHKG